jgi:hypothetical protein
MPRFRTPPELRSSGGGGSALHRPSLNEVREAIAAAMQPWHFFVGKPFILEWQHQPSEEIVWEIYQGRLLDVTHTRLRQLFESWNLFCVEAGSRSAEPILSVKLHAGSRQVHVTRAVHCHAWEGYDAGDNVYLSRETHKWVRELVGSIDLDRYFGLDDLRDEIISLLFHAVTGSSRLPLQSLEAPLPAFSLGYLGYYYRTEIGTAPSHFSPMACFGDLIEHGLRRDLAWPEKAKLLELLLRSTGPADLGAAADLFVCRWRALGHSSDEFAALCRTLFNEVALSPYTDFVNHMLGFLKTVASGGYLSAAAHIDFLSYMLRQNARHLTAYDLITFHHRGANYPDALLLDAVLKSYLALIEQQPDLFIPAPEDAVDLQQRKRLRRRALRQAWLLRRTYEGLPVPDAPTSPGENARVLPPPYQRVPEEQILDPSKRTKRLFEEGPLNLGARGREVMRHCIADLRQPEELQELGIAVFLDRPLGVFKAPMEPDRTLLLSYETFSPSMAERRLQFLAKDRTSDLSGETWESCRHYLRSTPLRGIPITPIERAQKPGAVALHDAARAADDFVVLRTTRKAARAFLAQFDFTALAGRFSLDYLDAHHRVLIVSAASTRLGPQGVLDVYDEQLRRRLELHIDSTQGYQSRAGHEYPVAGLRVVGVWGPDGAGASLRQLPLEQEGISLPPRS